MYPLSLSLSRSFDASNCTLCSVKSNNLTHFPRSTHHRHGIFVLQIDKKSESSKLEDVHMLDATREKEI